MLAKNELGGEKRWSLCFDITKNKTKQAVAVLYPPKNMENKYEHVEASVYRFISLPPGKKDGDEMMSEVLANQRSPNAARPTTIKPPKDKGNK